MYFTSDQVRGVEEDWGMYISIYIYGVGMIVWGGYGWKHNKHDCTKPAALPLFLAASTLLFLSPSSFMRE